MKKIILSVMMIAMVAMFGYGATHAYFTSAVTIEDMTFATGTIHITDTSETWTKTVSFTNLKPGDHVRKWVTVINDGTLDIDSLTVNANNVTDPNGLLGQIKISSMGKLVGGVEDYAYFTPDWTTGANVLPWMVNADMLDVAYYRTPAGLLHSGESYSMIFDFTIPTTMGNEWQGKTAQFDMVFTAEQSHTGANLF